MGNCGVGFAPVRPDGEDFLIELMEGVEDIPGTALHEGIDWEWESFPEYLDALDATPRALDVAAQVPARRAAGLRDGRAGPRRRPTDDEIARDGRASPRRRCDAGAVGFTHVADDPAPLQARPRARHHAVPDELLALGDAIGRAGHGVFQVISDHAGRRRPSDWWSTSSTAPAAPPPTRWPRRRYAPRRPRRARRRRALDAPTGVEIVPRSPTDRPACCSACSPRCTRSSPTRPTARSPTCRWPSGSPSCASPTCAPRCWPRSRRPPTRSPAALMSRWDQMFPLGDPRRLQPPASASVAPLAAPHEAQSPGRRSVLELARSLQEGKRRPLRHAPPASSTAASVAIHE